MTLLRTSAAAHDIAQQIVCDFKPQSTTKPSEERRKANTLKVTKIKKDDRDLKKVSEIDYGKHEKLERELDRADEIQYWEELARKNAGAQGAKPPACAHDHQKEIAIYEKPTDDKITAADRFREEGNAAYREKIYGLAAVHYRKALLYFDYTFPETPEQEAKTDRVKLAAHLNLAACKCHLEDWDEVLIQCYQALLIDPESVKAFYRRGWAYLERDEFDKAAEALGQARKREPLNRAVLEMLKRLQDKKQDYRLKSAENARKMVSAIAVEASSAPTATSPTLAAAASTATGTRPLLGLDTWKVERDSDFSEERGEEQATQESFVLPVVLQEGTHAEAAAAGVTDTPTDSAETRDSAGDENNVARAGDCATTPTWRAKPARSSVFTALEEEMEDLQRASDVRASDPMERTSEGEVRSSPRSSDPRSTAILELPVQLEGDEEGSPSPADELFVEQTRCGLVGLDVSAEEVGDRYPPGTMVYFDEAEQRWLDSASFTRRAQAEPLLYDEVDKKIEILPSSAAPPSSSDVVERKGWAASAPAGEVETRRRASSGSRARPTTSKTATSPLQLAPTITDDAALFETFVEHAKFADDTFKEKEHPEGREGDAGKQLRLLLGTSGIFFFLLGIAMFALEVYNRYQFRNDLRRGLVRRQAAPAHGATVELDGPTSSLPKAEPVHAPTKFYVDGLNSISNSK